MENNCNHNCDCCGNCISLDKSDFRVRITKLGEGIGQEYYCKQLQRYVGINWYCDDHFSQDLVIVSEKGIQRTRGNKHNVNIQ